MPDWEIAYALLEDRLDEQTARAATAERELAAIRWRAKAIELSSFFGLLLNPVTSTTDEVCDALADWARAIDAAVRTQTDLKGEPLDRMLARIEQARQVYA